LLNLGLAEWRLGRWQEACKLLESSLGVLKTIGDQRGLASREFYLGLSYEAGGDSTQAADHFRQALDAFDAIGANSGMVEAQAGLARLALKQEDVAEAGELALKVIKFLNVEGNQGLELPILAYLTCIKVFVAQGDITLVVHLKKEALKIINARLSMIDESKFKEVFLADIPENRELVELEKEASQGK
jgi:tetratricopeptide (TPR) repeat protein